MDMLRFLHSLEIGFRFPENLFQSQSIETVQNFTTIVL